MKSGGGRELGSSSTANPRLCDEDFHFHNNTFTQAWKKKMNLILNMTLIGLTLV